MKVDKKNAERREKVMRQWRDRRKKQRITERRGMKDEEGRKNEYREKEKEQREVKKGV